MKTQNEPMQIKSNVQPLIVNTTNDLSQFKTLKGNRPINMLHSHRLADSISKYGMLMNPILVNSQYEVIDGQHRLEAAKIAGGYIHYIIVPDYGLKQVHALNLNQKNWTAKEYMEGYADLGIKSYMELKDFKEKHHYFTLRDCISLCSNLSSTNFSTKRDKSSKSGMESPRLNFNEGTWVTRDMKQAESEALKIKMLEPFFKDGYNNTIFVGTMLTLFHEKSAVFSFTSFLHKLKLQPYALQKTATRDQCKVLIEEIYNYKRRDKISLRY